jgi:hypothetical protein
MIVMKSENHKLRTVAAWAICSLLSVGLLSGGLMYLQLPALSVSGDHPEETIPGKDSFQSTRTRVRVFEKLDALWKQRRTKNIVKNVLPFVKHPLLTVQLKAVTMLGRLENPIALVELNAMKAKLSGNNNLMAEGEMASSPLNFAVPLAIGRIRSRGLHGKKKVEAVLAPLGLTFNHLAAFTHQISGDKYGRLKVGNRVVEEVLDVLYIQKRKGEDISSLIGRLKLRPGQKMLLQAAQSSPETQAKVILDYITLPGIGGGDEGWMTNYLLDLGPKSRKVALDYSARIFRDRKKYPAPVGYIDVLYALAIDEEPGAKALLTKWGRDRDQLVRGRATQSLVHLSAQSRM